MRDWTPELIERAFTRDRALLKELFADIEPIVIREIRFFLARIRPAWVRPELEDAVNDAFASLLAGGGRGLRSWEPRRGSSLATWVKLLVRRGGCDAIRRQLKKHRNELPALPGAVERAGPDPLRQLEGRDDLAFALTRLDEHSEDALLILRLKFVDGLSSREIGALLGLLPNTVDRRIGRMRKYLRELDRRSNEQKKGEGE